MKPERIVFIHPFLLHYHYPRFKALSNECKNLGISFQNIQLSGYVGTYHSLYRKFDEEFENIVIFPNQALEKIPSRTMWSTLKLKLKELAPDVIFTYGYSLDIMRKVRLWAERVNIATVLISDSNMIDKRRYKVFEWLKSLFVSRYDAAFVAGKNSSIYLQGLGVPKDKIIAGYDVIDNSLFFKQDFENKLDIARIRKKWNLPDKYFLFVGRLVIDKNIHGLLGAYSDYVNLIVKNGDVPWGLVVCGNGPSDEEFKELAKKLLGQLSEQVLFMGQILQPELIDFYSSATCFLLPSFTESWGLVINEALACELPVILSDRCGCAADLVINGINGWVFNPYEQDELSRRMLNVHQLSSIDRAAMGQKGREIISRWGLERFSQSALDCAQIAINHKH